MTRSRFEHVGWSRRVRDGLPGMASYVALMLALIGARAPAFAQTPADAADVEAIDRAIVEAVSAFSPGELRDDATLLVLAVS